MHETALESARRCLSRGLGIFFLSLGQLQVSGLPQYHAAETTKVTCCNAPCALQAGSPSLQKPSCPATDLLLIHTATVACDVLTSVQHAVVGELARVRTGLTLRPSARSFGSSLKRSTILPEAAIMASSSLMLLPKRLLAMSSSKPLHRYYTLLMSAFLSVQWDEPKSCSVQVQVPDRRWSHQT